MRLRAAPLRGVPCAAMLLTVALLAIGWMARSPRGTSVPVPVEVHLRPSQAGEAPVAQATAATASSDTALAGNPLPATDISKGASVPAAAVRDAAAALEELHEELQRARLLFCEAHRDLEDGADGLVRVMGHAPPPLDTVKSYPIWVHARNDFVSSSIQDRGYWEDGDTLEMLRLMEAFQQRHKLERHEVVLLDIGANVGWYAVTAAAFGYTVVAFEPLERNLDAMRRTLCDTPELQERITLVTKGLGSKAQLCSFFVDEKNLGDGFTGCGVDVRNGTIAGKIKVGEFELTTLDDVLGAAALALAGRVAVLKIDVEGFEQQVYAGGKEFVNQVQPEYIFAEINGPALMAASGATPEDMFKLYDDWGFDLRYKNYFEGDPEPPAFFGTLGSRSGASRQATNFYLSKKQR